jgi:nucleotide-binding universal stress UspA family protein
LFKHILVPLDGSRLAEAALPAAAYLASRLDATVTLVHIIERDAPPEIHGDRHLVDAAEACVYLDEVAERSFAAGAVVNRHVHTAQAADVGRGIVEHVDELQPDLIVMCTHGRGGLGDFLYGSIAQQVLARAITPVLLIRPEESLRRTEFHCRRLLVALDGDPEHEDGLPVAAGLAQACQASLTLALVVPTLGTLSGREAATGRVLPSATRALLGMAEEDAGRYLERHRAALDGQGLVVTSVVRRGEPAPTIIAISGQVAADLIVLGTHGKAGMAAFWSGSLPPRLSRRWRRPLLLVPVGRKDPAAPNRGAQPGAPAAA